MLGLIKNIINKGNIYSNPSFLPIKYHRPYPSMVRVIALTGYPGVGKTAIGDALKELGFRVITLYFRKERVLLKTLSRRVILGKTPVFVEGFWSHLINNITDIVLVSAPREKVLESYSKRGYELPKILENLLSSEEHQIEQEIAKVFFVKKTFIVNDFITPTQVIAEQIVAQLAL